MKQIILTFKKNGTVEKEVNGYTDGTCLAETDFIDNALGEVEETEMKPEFYDINPEGLDQQNKVYT